MTLLLVGLLTHLYVCGQADVDLKDRENWVAYSSPECINLEHPKMWRIRKDYERYDIYLCHRFLKKNQRWWYVTIERIDLPQGDPKQVFQDYLIKTKSELFELVEEMKFEYVEEIELQNYTAYSWGFSGFIDERILEKVRQIFFFQGGSVFALTFVCPPESFEDYEKVFLEVAKTISVDPEFIEFREQ